MEHTENREDTKYKLELLEAEMIEKNNRIRQLEADNKILRMQGKEARKQCRKLEARINLMLQSRWFKLGCKIKAFLFKIKHLACGPYHFLFNIFHSSTKKVSPLTENSVEAIENVSVDEPSANQDPRADHELVLPTIRDNTCDLFDIDGDVTAITVIVCIHNAPYDVEECLLSLWENRSFPYKIVLVDDGSDELTAEYVKKYAELTQSILIRNEAAYGYTISANKGLHATSSNYYILLNSDTIVTYGWVEKMLRCFRNYPQTGIVSPLSNAASYQSVPEVHDQVTGDWKINSLPSGFTVEMMGQVVERATPHVYPCLPVLNGFCFMISQKVIDTIGYLDEKLFPKGYGEEVDYCIRATKAGFELRVADDTYIFHEKSKSFTHKVRKELGSESKEKLKNKHGEQEYLSLNGKLCDCKELPEIRQRVTEKIDSVLKMPVLYKKIAFLLTAKGGSGGANSVCQEVMGMRKLGIESYIINSSNYQPEFECNYPELVPYIRYYNKKNNTSLYNTCAEFDIIIGTIFTTIKLLKGVQAHYPDKIFGYYIQDYEPLFFNRDDPYWQEAYDSYTLFDQMCMFAKTTWIADTVCKEHGKKVNLVEPSIDISLYNPYIINKKIICAPISITAMIRPKTERRNPQGTLRVLKQLKKKYQETLSVTLFGCEDSELKALGEIADFEYINYGVLKRWEVARLLSHSTAFLDMSTYQAFGRTGLESMCLGCIAIIPEEGGASKYAVDEENTIVVDTSDENKVFSRICDILDNPERLYQIQMAGLKKAQEYNIMNAVVSEINVINECCQTFCKN